jgi:hypothetical protein
VIQSQVSPVACGIVFEQPPQIPQRGLKRWKSCELSQGGWGSRGLTRTREDWRRFPLVVSLIRAVCDTETDRCHCPSESLLFAGNSLRLRVSRGGQCVRIHQVFSKDATPFSKTCALPRDEWCFRKAPRPNKVPPYPRERQPLRGCE